MEKQNGKIIFYGDEVPVTFPPSYNQFLVMLREILGLDENFVSNINLSFRDSEEDKIEIKMEEDYKKFMAEIQKGKQMTMTIEVKEESNLDIKKCSSSILNYVEKKSGNINNLSEEIKKNSIKLDEENNIQNEKNLDLDENINNNFNNEEKANQLIMNNNFNNNINNINNNMNNNNNINISIPQKENKNMQNLQQNNNINNQIPIQQNRIQMPSNNIQNNNINNINQISQNNNNISQMSQMSQNQNASHVDMSKLTNKFLYMISFPYACSLCRVGPIYRVMYFCRECNLVICPRCEQKEGERHFHPLYKVQNGSQFKCLNINGASAMDKIMDRVEGAYNSVLGFFGAGGNNNQNSNANNRALQQQQVPQLVSNVQLARNIYDLRNVTDQQIEDALIKAQGNIDQAVFSLVSK